MAKRTWAIIALFFVAIFYSLNFNIAKEVMPHYIEPFGFILFRVTGACLLFWIVGSFIPKEKIYRRDYPRIIFAAMFGMAINMLAFFKGLNYTSPINASVIMVTAPIIVLLFSIFFLGETITISKILGLCIGFMGTVLIIYYGKGNPARAIQPVLGNFLVFINAASYAVYLILVKKLTATYHPLTFIKWMYLLGIIFVLPFGFTEVLEMPISRIPLEGYLKISYVVVFATFGTYILNIFAIRELKPTTVAVFIYLQPLLTTLFAVAMGTDYIDGIKIVSALLICLGVYMVSKKPVSTTH